MRVQVQRRPACVHILPRLWNPGGQLLDQAPTANRLNPTANRQPHPQIKTGSEVWNATFSRIFRLTHPGPGGSPLAAGLGGAGVGGAAGGAAVVGGGGGPAAAAIAAASSGSRGGVGGVDGVEGGGTGALPASGGGPAPPRLTVAADNTLAAYDPATGFR
jgi:hypothetical protein